MRALQLFAVLSSARLLVVTLAPDQDWRGLLFVWQDVLVALALAAFDRALGRRGRAAGWVAYALLAAWTALNVAVVGVLPAPLTAHMLSAAGTTLGDSIAFHASWPVLAPAAGVLAVAAVLPWWRRELPPRAGWVLTAAALCALPLGAWATGRVTAARPCNAVVALAASFLPRVPDWPAHGTAVDWRRMAESAPDAGLAALRGSARGRHVVLVVLESVGARYLAPYGSRDDPMPNLTEIAERALVFDHAYAVYPESIKGLVALLYALHPAMDTEPRQYRRPPVPALAELLARAGYDTALVHAGRFAYLGMADVLAGAGFTTLLDAGDIGGNRRSSFGVDEPAAVAALLAHVDRVRARQPDRRCFLAWMPIAGHHPYDSFAPGPFDGGELFGAYRNAIHSADLALGQLVDGLRRRGMWDDTLLVVVGDHGQAFGQHPGNFGHTFHLFEENVHVPWLVALPGRVEQTVRVRPVASHVDVAPTVLDLLGLAAPAGCEGRSMLAGRDALALLFTDYAQAFVGLRDGRFKFVHEVASGRSSLFDLAVDPEERDDRSAGHAERVADYRALLLAWVAAQRDGVARW